MTTTHAAIYVRQSLDRTLEGHAIERQESAALDLTERRGWTVHETLRDNDTSAAGKVKRPGFDRLIELIERGEISVVVAWDLTRLTRNARDTLRLLETGQRAGVTVALVQGSDMALGTADGRTLAGILASVAQGEIDKKAERQRAAAAQRAERGEMPIGTRLTGYKGRGEIEPAEAVIVRELFTRFAAGEDLKTLAAVFNERGVPTRNGRSWRVSTVRDMLTNARYAGRVIFKGEVIEGAVASWPAIVTPELFDQVAIRLADPRRVTNRVGTARKHLGSGLFLCDTCGSAVRSFGDRYRCKDAHVNRTRAAIDTFVIDAVRGRLALPDLAARLPRPDDARVQELSDEIEKLEGRIRRIEADYDAELIDGRRYKVATEKANAELGAARTARARLAAPGAASSVLGAADPVKAFDGATLAGRRVVIAALCEVRLGRAPAGRKPFDPMTIGNSRWVGDTKTWGELLLDA